MLKNIYRNISPEIDKEAQKNGEIKTPILLEFSAKHIMEFAGMVKREIWSNETLKQWRATENKLKEFITVEFHVKAITLTNSHLDLLKRWI